MSKKPENISKKDRRAFLKKIVAGGGGIVAGSLAGCIPDSDKTGVEQTNGTLLPDGKDPENFTVHARNPLNLETRRDRFGSGVVVPNNLVFVRNNLPLPDPSILEDRDAWTLQIEGVSEEKELTVAELKKTGLETVATVIQCSGNGRSFFSHNASGSQWGVGAAGCVIWSGVPIRKLVSKLGGTASGMNFMTATGGEEIPEGVDPETVVAERSVPIEKGIRDGLLAWEMNGEPIPRLHGGPLRLIIPGYYGCNQIKYIKRLAFTPEESNANMQQTSYRVRPVGGSASPDQPTMWEMNVKSWINYPAGTEKINAGEVQIHGVALAGEQEITNVEVSTDGGTTWEQARFTGPDLGRYAWRQFVFAAKLTPGTHVLASRTTDENGNTQPENRLENERGYGNNSWRDHAVAIEVV